MAAAAASDNSQPGPITSKRGQWGEAIVEVLPDATDVYDNALYAKAIGPLIDTLCKADNKNAIFVWLSTGYLHSGKFDPTWIKKHKFELHQARLDGKFVLYTLWRNDKIPNMIPAPPTACRGVAVVVLNKDKTKCLMVKERRRDVLKMKLVTGVVDVGENVVDAAIREVKEETKVDISDPIEPVHFAGGLETSNARCAGAFDVITCVVFVIDEAKSDVQADTNEVEKAEWVSIDKIEKLWRLDSGAINKEAAPQPFLHDIVDANGCPWSHSSVQWIMNGVHRRSNSGIKIDKRDGKVAMLSW